MGRVRVVYEDEYVIVADKPTGLLTVPTPKKEKTTLASLLNAYPAHRLDRDTSGLILLAKDKETQELLMEEFKSKRVKKSYIAYVQGRLDRTQGVIDRPVSDNLYEPAKSARTEYSVLEQRPGFSIVKVVPFTGRTNQIRIHFKQIGHPLVGERRFAFAKDYEIKFRRTALHSQELEFIHPVTKKKLAFFADMPEDMQKFLEER